jgi:hypothetical protein
LVGIRKAGLEGRAESTGCTLMSNWFDSGFF